MHTQHNAYSRAGLADFNSAMKRAAAGGRSSAQNQQNDPREGRREHQTGAFNNRNLSSIISRITDDGPANLRIDDDVNHIQASHSARTQRAARANADVSGPGISAEGGHQYMSAQSFELGDAGIRNAAISAAGRRRSLWQPLALIALVSVVAVMGFLIYQLKLQTEDMEHALHSSREQMRLVTSSQAQAQPQPPDVFPRLNSMNKALTELQQEMRGIKQGYQQSDSQLALEIPRDLEPRLLEIAAASEIVTVLQDEFERIQHEVKEMGSELNVIKQGITPVQHAAVLPKTSAKRDPDTPNLVVNLASLTNKDKAQAAFDKLRQAGISPRIQQVMVNGRIVFRISVEGFRSREAASAFITEARSKYGFDGGWIRQI